MSPTGNSNKRKATDGVEVDDAVKRFKEASNDSEKLQLVFDLCKTQSGLLSDLSGRVSDVEEGISTIGGRIDAMEKCVNRLDVDNSARFLFVYNLKLPFVPNDQKQNVLKLHQFVYDMAVFLCGTSMVSRSNIQMPMVIPGRGGVKVLKIEVGSLLLNSIFSNVNKLSKYDCKSVIVDGKKLHLERQMTVGELKRKETAMVVKRELIVLFQGYKRDRIIKEIPKIQMVKSFRQICVGRAEAIPVEAALDYYKINDNVTKCLL